MPRYIIQSMATGRFLGPGSIDQHDTVEWFRSLRDASGGVTDDMERIDQLLADHCDWEMQPVVVDLDRMGRDY